MRPACWSVWATTDTLLRRTPLTQLLDNHPGAPPIHWEDAVFVLRDACRAQLGLGQQAHPADGHGRN